MVRQHQTHYKIYIIKYKEIHKKIVVIYKTQLHDGCSIYMTMLFFQNQ